MVGTRSGVLPCLWCGPKGAPLYLGDSGDGDDKHYGTHLMVVLGRPTYVSTALGLTKHLFEGLQQRRRGLCPSPPRFLRPVGESPLYGLERLPRGFPCHQGEQPVVAVAPLAAFVGQLEAVAAGEVSAPRRTVELSYTTTALLSVEHTGAGEPPAHPAKGGSGGL